MLIMSIEANFMAVTEREEVRGGGRRERGRGDGAWEKGGGGEVM